ncbi:Hypothetical protein DIP1568 [Corynebacterium diphtheriae]|uniref:Uncharacterized protein n=1 Tax=Corynebacterium diphtheriae (strain ATCC 700971 / NCTC 13129 / Biotype gravis) TaxID=257309 RepID=Q6NGF7_CORDI|nr:Hypothetical protein DIP1568 [Corynebacterium diphtheriae]
MSSSLSSSILMNNDSQKAHPATKGGHITALAPNATGGAKRMTVPGEELINISRVMDERSNHVSGGGEDQSTDKCP